MKKVVDHGNGPLLANVLLKPLGVEVGQLMEVEYLADHIIIRRAPKPA